ncbi:interferon-induced protein 44-like, partial [Astyanax mexicanus]
SGITEFVTDLTDEQVGAGDTITLQCKVNTEELTATWEKDGQTLHCVPGKHVMKQDGKSLSLKIKNVEEEDDGIYTLTLINSKAFKIHNDKVKVLNFLLCGPYGAGKSSIINTINSVLEGQISVGYQGCLESSFHKRQVGNAKDGFLPLVLNDTMGLESEPMYGLHPDDIIAALKGHITDGYTFTPNTPINENSPYYRENPSLSDRMHCLVHVIPAENCYMDEFFQKMNKIKDAANKMDLPQVILMTKVDKTCTLTKKDLKHVYNSKKIKDKMHKCHIELGIKMYAIFPMKNYHEESDVSEDVNCLMLHALTRIVRWADDYADKYSNN